jgi:predicted nucleic acid-binding protein
MSVPVLTKGAIDGYLVDTNVALRWTQPSDPDYPLAQTSITALRLRREDLFITPQNVIEFWNVATRPVANNGLGLTPAAADAEVMRLEAFFPMAPDTPAVYSEWRRLVTTVGVSGVKVHDARLVAVALVHGLTHLLTFNTVDFTRYPGVTAVHPKDV